MFLYYFLSYFVALRNTVDVHDVYCTVAAPHVVLGGPSPLQDQFSNLFKLDEKTLGWGSGASGKMLKWMWTRSRCHLGRGSQEPSTLR